MVESRGKGGQIIEESKGEMTMESQGDILKAQDDFFYKISQISEKEFKVEVPSTKKRYMV